MRIYYFVKKLNNIQAFLFITARNASLDFLKYRQRMRENLAELNNKNEQEPDAQLFAETDISAEVLAFIYNEVEKLPEKCREIFKLAYLERLPVKEIAIKLNISPQTVANQKTTALKILRLKVLDRPGLFLWLLCFLGGMRD
jgi:RNA polymerase sigma factor (sigma-70 family)